MEMDKGLIDKLLGDYQKPEDLIGEERAAEAVDPGHRGASVAGGADHAPGV